jgi:hypothetical protein
MARSVAIVGVVGAMLLVWVYLLGQGGMVERSFLVAACLAGGPFSVAGGAIGWEWFLSDPKARPMVQRFGRTGARCFYVVLGASLAAFGVWAYSSGSYLGRMP